MEQVTPVLARVGVAVRLKNYLRRLRRKFFRRSYWVVVEPGQPRGLRVDTIMAIDERSFFIRGWMRDEEAAVTRLTAVSPEGSRVELLERIFRYPRPDIEQFYGAALDDNLQESTGFIAYFEVEAPSRVSTGWTLEAQNARGVSMKAGAPRVIRDAKTARDSILRIFNQEHPSGEDLMLNHVFPALSRLQERLKKTVEVRSVVQYGTPIEAPDVSIILPLYQRIDFLEQQLAQFVHDPEILRAELIYVLDSPELADSLSGAAAQLFPLYQVPFKVATLERNVGFSAANNVGASLARGRLLLLLNSDVLPDEPGWLGRMTEFYDSMPGIGALGPKLLYEDDSLQHAGMYFSPLADSPLWENRHYFKGLHRHLPAANVARPVPAVTGACLMIDTNLYRQFGGLQGIYVQGDYEDSDLCLRLTKAGYENWYLPDVELYHLEGQSYAFSGTRQLYGRYNTWLQTRLWNEHIEAVMAQYAPTLPMEPGVARNRQRFPELRGGVPGTDTSEEIASGRQLSHRNKSE